MHLVEGLKDEIEVLILQGYLENYIHDGGDQSNAQNPDKQQVEREINNQPKAGMVNMISRGMWFGGGYKKTLQRGEG